MDGLSIENDVEYWRTMCQAAEIERDEARTQASIERVNTVAWKRQADDAMAKEREMLKERDEAREEAKQFEGMVKDELELTKRWKAKGDELREERDEAREWARRLYAQCKAADALLAEAQTSVDFVRADDAMNFEVMFEEYETIRMVTDD